MITFTLTTPRATYEGATIHPGFYPREKPTDPQQIGWQVEHRGEALGTATVNLWDPPVFPADRCVFVKITPQFAGWLESLQVAGLVEPTGRIESAGHVERYAAECRVLNPGLLVVDDQ
jgi:hypothetical protein